MRKPPPKASKLIDVALRSLSFAFRVHPHARLRGVRKTSEVPYLPDAGPAQTLDVYRPEGKPRGVVLYVHGGGFRILSKDTHWMMALAFARAGYVVFSMNYRLAPEHPFPAAVEDVVAAWRWVVDHARSYGGDPNSLVLAGESAGANLVTAMTVARSFRLDDPRVRPTWDLPLRAVVPLCGILEVSRPQRFRELGKTKDWVQRRIELICDGYGGGDHPLASPLLVLESDREPALPLPPFASSVGDADPIYDDTVRLERALARRAVRHHVSVHPGEPHAFQAIFWRPEARRAWRECLAFLDAVA